MMEDAIMGFGQQFDWQPHIENADRFKTYQRFIVCGMGGSALAPWLIKQYGPRSHITIHRDYGLPQLSEDALKDSLVICSSYSGNTEETLDSMSAAIERGLAVAAATTGGRLLEIARAHGIPSVQLPDMHLEPRMALGLSMLAIARLMQDIDLEDVIRVSGKAVHPTQKREEGGRIGLLLANKIPIIYASAPNLPAAYIWKIKLNETAKIPAFCNSFPELCHNEFTGFDVVDATRSLSGSLCVIFLEDDTDHPRNQKRMQIANDILKEKGIPVERLRLEGEGFEKIFDIAILADWVSYDLARRYGVPNPETPLVQEFKRRMVA